MMRFVLGLSVAITSFIGVAQAGEEKKCSEQYSLEEHAILEWAALGGDPHAQFAIAQCAYPAGAKKLTDAEKQYAAKWVTIAACEALDENQTEIRNVRTRRLKEAGDLSFRRFGGESDDEKFSKRDKLFKLYRTRKLDELKDRNKRLRRKISDDVRLSAQRDIVRQFTAMGAIGQLRLSELSSCEYFDASPSFVAASWIETAETWRNTDGLNKIYGDSERDNWSIADESVSKLQSLDGAALQTVAYERQAISSIMPTKLSTLQDKAALAELDKLSAPFIHAGETGEATRSLTSAVQYALESLGWLEFVNGPDNDYGPSTTEAVRKMQAHYGEPETRLLSNQRIRATICQAATEKADPVSLFHVATMYANGWGFAKDLNKARDAIERAKGAMAVKMSAADDLPEWKQRNYPLYNAQIDLTANTIEASWSTLPKSQKAKPGSTEICN